MVLKKTVICWCWLLNLEELRGKKVAGYSNAFASSQSVGWTRQILCRHKNIHTYLHKALRHRIVGSKQGRLRDDETDDY